MSVNTSDYGIFKPSGTINITDLSGDMIGISKDDLEKISILAEQALTSNRVSLRNQGYQVEAFSRKSELNREISDHDLSNENSPAKGNTSGLEAHPNLPFMGGKANQLFIPGIEENENLHGYLSEMQKDEIAKKKKRKAEELKEKLQMKMKMARPAPKAAPVNVIKYTNKRPPPRLTPNW